MNISADLFNSCTNFLICSELRGLAVHIGARIGALAGSGEVLASRTVRDLSAGSGLVFESPGPQQLRGPSETVDVYRLGTR